MIYGIKMIRCKKCLYPETTKPYISFDDEGVCSRCRVIEWKERKEKLKSLIMLCVILIWSLHLFYKL